MSIFGMLRAASEDAISDQVFDMVFAPDLLAVGFRPIVDHGQPTAIHLSFHVTIAIVTSGYRLGLR
jgi:hypothetical protein